MASTDQTPWWLEAGDRQCPFCDVFHHDEVLVHCVACDRPVCTVCFVEVFSARAVYCPECDPDNEAED